MEVGQPYCFRVKRVDIGSFDHGITATAQIPRSLIIRQHKNNIGANIVIHQICTYQLALAAYGHSLPYDGGA